MTAPLMDRQQAEAIIESSYPTQDDDCEFALAMFDVVGHYGLGALRDEAVVFMARTILERREEDRRKEEALAIIDSIRLGPAEILPFPSRG